MLYLDDKLPSHPKILKAAAKLGPNGYALALSMYVVGLGYAREHLTDGFIPTKFVTSCGHFQTPQSIANVLCSRTIRLWHRKPGGYQIHDYHDWNRKAKDVKEKREKDRIKKQRQRGAADGQFVHLSPGVSPRDSLRDSRARGTTYHDPRTTNHVLRLAHNQDLATSDRGTQPEELEHRRLRDGTHDDDF